MRRFVFLLYTTNSALSCTEQHLVLHGHEKQRPDADQLTDLLYKRAEKAEARYSH